MSIGPGALHALAASIAPVSDGIGVWYFFGDETIDELGEMGVFGRWNVGNWCGDTQTLRHEIGL
jgi:hypothetical protein